MSALFARLTEHYERTAVVDFDGDVFDLGLTYEEEETRRRLGTETCMNSEPFRRERRESYERVAVGERYGTLVFLMGGGGVICVGAELQYVGAELYVWGGVICGGGVIICGG